MLLNSQQLVLKVQSELEPFKLEFDQYQPGLQGDNQLKLDDLFKECVNRIIEQIYNTKIIPEDVSLPLKPTCLCGDILEPIKASQCY
ncbi:unnamed protein product [Didymodactylos carnosus]|uniref:Uncharacterized protein n=1 Tax=Didymodactylos carnosus TaxID=1234261 RepID=A0A8S2F558_9BILA|nr:unnamed protein product [Didymodactylos carnosus]CAF4202713.1 unnamed protein product [Didymodactylos carnosus]